MTPPGPTVKASYLRMATDVLVHLLILGLGVSLVALDAWDDLKYQLAKAMR